VEAARTCKWTRGVIGGRIRPALNHAAAVRDRGGGRDVEGFQELVVNAKEGLAWGGWSVFTRFTRRALEQLEKSIEARCDPTGRLAYSLTGELVEKHTERTNRVSVPTNKAGVGSVEVMLRESQNSMSKRPGVAEERSTWKIKR
jgi:hypothetical protein